MLCLSSGICREMVSVPPIALQSPGRDIAWRDARPPTVTGIPKEAAHVCVCWAAVVHPFHKHSVAAKVADRPAAPVGSAGIVHGLVAQHQFQSVNGVDDVVASVLCPRGWIAEMEPTCGVCRQPGACRPTGLDGRSEVTCGASCGSRAPSCTKQGCDRQAPEDEPPHKQHHYRRQAGRRRHITQEEPVTVSVGISRAAVHNRVARPP